MAFIEMNFASGGGTISNDVVSIYKDGWKDIDGVTYNKVNTIDNDGYFVLGSSEGDGVYINDDISEQYSTLIIIAYSGLNSVGMQYGRCSTSASLPTIISKGTGRASDYKNSASNEIAFAIEIKEGYGLFFGRAGGTAGNNQKIKYVFLVKK